MNKHPEYTEREKEMRINEFEAGAILEDIKLMFGTIQNDAARLDHNLGVVAHKLDEALTKLAKGGVEI